MEQSNVRALVVPTAKSAAQIAPAASAVRPKDIQELKYIAEAFAVSGAFPDARTAAQAFVKIMAGQEYGIGPMASMLGLSFIKDKPALSATLIAGQIKKHPIYDYRRYWLTRVAVCANCEFHQTDAVHTTTDRALSHKWTPREIIARVKDELNDRVIGCEIEFFENGEFVGRSVFTDVDQAAAGLSGDNWKKYPKNMMFSRAMTNGARAYCPDVFGGIAVYTPDELDPKIPLDGEGRPLVLVAPEAPPPAADGAPTPPTLKRLQALFAAVKAFVPLRAGVETMTLGLWLSDTVAPGLEARRDPITGKNQGLTDSEKLEAARRLEALVLEHVPAEAARLGVVAAAAPAAVVVTPAPAEQAPQAATPFDVADEAEPEGEALPPATAQAQLAFAEATGAAVVFAPPGSDAHKRIMARFGERDRSLKAYFPAAKTANDRRHALALDVLRNPQRTSSKVWTEAEYRAIDAALDRISADTPTL